MADLPPASLRLLVDTAVLAANWRTLDAMSGAAAAGAAVKANAYGLGVDAVVPALRDAGCRQFFVAHWGEIPAVLRHVSAGEVCVLHGVTTAAEADFARATGVLPVINSAQQAGLWNAAGGGLCHLMVDTGINRLGVPREQLGDAAVAALEVDLLLSHLASADEDSALNDVQLARFASVIPQVGARATSLANSAGIALGAPYHFDLTRPGLALYGGIARPEMASAIRPVVQLQAEVIQRRTLAAGDSVGYNATFAAACPMEVATVAIGYADGFLRVRGPGNSLTSHGCDLPVLGRVSMDMTVVDCTLAVDLKAGDFVDIPMDLPKQAALSGLSQYELLTILGDRFARQ
ncbi:MAG: alanine racemase [Alteraurantiacibacter sp.]